MKADSGRSLLFLDFDGVMHPVGCGVDRLFCHLPLLEAWLRSRPAVDVVVSSSWREVHPLDLLRSFFSDELQQRVVGATPVMDRGARRQLVGDLFTSQYEREIEVECWLHENGHRRRPWAALDDQRNLFNPSNTRVVICDGEVGLSTGELEQVDAVLARGAK